MEARAKNRTIATAPKLSSMRIPKAGEVVASQLRRRIISGELKEGDTLAQERDLVQEFGVSRPTLREAFRILEAEGLISISRGTRGGALIHQPNVRSAARYMSFVLQANKIDLDDIYRSLVLFEPTAVRLLAENATKADVAVLRGQLKEIMAVIDNDREYGVAAARFHRTLVELVGIKSLTLIMDMLTSLVAGYFASVTSTAGAQMDNRSTKLKALRAKEKLVGMIEAHQATEAEALWKKHLEVTRGILSRWQPGKAVQDLLEFI